MESDPFDCGELDVDGMEFVIPTTSPVQFDPAAAHASIDRIMTFQPRYGYLTHYSRIGHLAHHAQSLHDFIDAHVAIAQREKNNPDRQTTIAAALRQLFMQRLAECGQ